MSDKSVYSIVSDAFNLATISNKERVEIAFALIEDSIINELSNGKNQRYFLTHDEITDRLNIPYLGNKNMLVRETIYKLEQKGIVITQGRKCWLAKENNNGNK